MRAGGIHSVAQNFNHVYINRCYTAVREINTNHWTPELIQERSDSLYRFVHTACSIRSGRRICVSSLKQQKGIKKRDNVKES
jgi:hypothetical protein